MIEINQTQAVLEFGTGDICIASGSIDDDKQKVGFVVFCNQEPREIGKGGDVIAGQKYKSEDFPVVMNFYKKESIDVVINALLNAKEQM